MIRVLLLCVSCVALSQAFKQGAPIEACAKRIPRHDSTVPTYNSGQYSFTYEPVGRNDYKVVIDGNGVSFKGFMVQALNSRNETIGQFHGDKDNIQVIKECNSVTHYNANPKNRVSLLWSGPAQDVHFWATVVEHYSKIYIDMLAHPVQAAHPAPAAQSGPVHRGRPVHPAQQGPVHPAQQGPLYPDVVYPDQRQPQTFFEYPYY